MSLKNLRRLMLACWRRRIDLTPREKGVKGAIERAIRAGRNDPRCLDAAAVENDANIDVHVRTTGPEILNDFKDADRTR